MEEKTNLYSEPADEIAAELTEDESISAAQSTDNQESSLDTDTSSSDYFKSQGNQPVIDNSSGLPLWERDLAEEDDFLRYMQLDEMLKTYQMEMSDTSASTSVAVVPAVIDATPIVSIEETFIAQKSAEGTPVADMPVKKLRSEIKKRNADLAHHYSVSKKTVPESSDTHDTALDMTDTLISPSSTLAHLNTDITNSSDIDHNVDNALEQLLTATASLLNADNLQSVVNDFAENDLSTLEQQLSQMAAIHSKLQHYLDIWKKTVNDNTNETT